MGGLGGFTTSRDSVELKVLQIQISDVSATPEAELAAQHQGKSQKREWVVGHSPLHLTSEHT
ncbi:MAG: hypothetical protein U9N43_04165 [Euryarchaeota archaeon]|nr:hypothetical protein [Euryarchaeota archaeon]